MYNMFDLPESENYPSQQPVYCPVYQQPPQWVPQTDHCLRQLIRMWTSVHQIQYQIPVTHNHEKYQRQTKHR